MKNIKIEEAEATLHAAYLHYVKEVEALALPEVIDILDQDVDYVLYLMSDGSTQLTEREV